MIIFTKDITDALNEGYEISFCANRNIGPGVLEMNMRKDHLRYQHFFDTVMTRDSEVIEEQINHVIRYAIRYEFPRILKGEKQ